jgi:hypothetical protein
VHDKDDSKFVKTSILLKKNSKEMTSHFNEEEH